MFINELPDTPGKYFLFLHFLAAYPLIASSHYNDFV